MKGFSDKVREGRKLLNLTQAELGELLGVSARAVISYETGVSVPHKNRITKLAEILGVSVLYLTDDSITDPTAGMTQENIVSETKRQYGDKASKEIEFLMKRSAALFAGGTLSQEQKDTFYGALSKAYWTAKEEAKDIYGKGKGE